MNVQDPDNVNSFLRRTPNSFPLTISKVLKSTGFKHVLLHVVQHMRSKEDTKSYASVITETKAEYLPSSPLDIEKISQVVQLFAAASAALAQPAAILGLSFTFFKWILDAVCANV
jgi:hypothetical protein